MPTQPQVNNVNLGVASNSAQVSPPIISPNYVLSASYVKAAAEYINFDLDWSNSPEGYDYWNNVYINLMKACTLQGYAGKNVTTHAGMKQSQKPPTINLFYNSQPTQSPAPVAPSSSPTKNSHIWDAVKGACSKG